MTSAKKTERDIKIQMSEWMAAASSFGQEYSSDPFIKIEKHDRIKVPLFEFREKHLAIAATCPGKNLTVLSAMDLSNDHKYLMSGKVYVDEIEHDVYNGDAADNRIRYLLREIINKTGVMQMTIHIWKRVFQSNGRANIAIIIEDDLGFSHNDNK